MLDHIIRFSIRNKLIIALCTVAWLGWGVYSLTNLPIDAVPDITNNQVQIITSAPSQSALDIERLVSFPIEQAMATIPGIVEVRSFSRFGLSVVNIVFGDDTDIYWARQQVSERLIQAQNTIPPQIGIPEMAPVTTGLGEIFQYIIRPKKGFENKYSPVDLRTIQDWNIRRQLLGIEGVADISSFGGFLKQYEVAIKPEKLRSYNLSIQDVFKALETNNQNTGGAYIDKKPTAYFIRSEGLIKSISDIENIVVNSTNSGHPILISHLADVKMGTAIRYGAMTYNNDGESVGAIVLMLKGENSNAVVHRVKEKMKQIETTLPEGLEVVVFLDRSDLVSRAIFTVEKNLVEGAIIVILVLVLFLGNLRAGLIVASVIPLSMLFAISMMNIFGVSGNLMSLGAIDFGLIIDGAVIIVEASMHHLGMRKVNRLLTQHEMDEEIYESATKIRSSAAFGEIIILIVYLPILALVGVEGKMFKPMAQTVIFAIMGAFILSLTYVPMISALFLSKKSGQHKPNFSDKMMDKIANFYKPLLLKALSRKNIIVGLAASLFLVSMYVFTTLGGEFLPTLDEGDFAVETRVMTGSSMSETVDASLKGGEILLREFPDEVKEVVGKIGSSEIPTDPMPIEACDLMVILKDKDQWTKADTKEELAELMQAKLENIPGVTFGFQQPIQMRFNELMTGVKQDVAIKIFGEDLDVLTDLSKKVAGIASGVEGIKDMYVEEVTGLPQIVITINREQVAKFGVSIESINLAINTAFAGQSAGLVYEGEKRFDLVVRLAENNRKNIEDVRNLFIETPHKQLIPLSQLADVSFKVGPNQIQRDDAKRRIIVGFNVRGRDVANVVKELQQKIGKDVKFPPGYYPTYGGQFENLQQAQARLSIAVPIALVLILVLLFFTFGSIKYALLIFTSIPMAAIGGIFALVGRDMPFSISAGVGFIALFGVAVLNGIVLIAEFNRLKSAGELSLPDIIVSGTLTRLRPVLMTAAVASLGFLPMALSHGSGAEVQKPLATVVIGGLISSTLLTLFVLPCLYMFFENIKPRKKSIASVAIILVLIGFVNPKEIQAQSLELRLDSAINIALRANPSVAINEAEKHYYEQQKKAAIDLPKTNVLVTYGQINSYPKNDNNIQISQSIPFPTQLSSQRALANSQVKSSKLKQDITKNDLIYQVKQSYINISYFRELELLLHQQDSVLKLFSKSAQFRYKAGESTFLEKTSAETKANEIGNLLALNQRDIEIELSNLQVLLYENKTLNPISIDLSSPDLEKQLTENISNNPNLHYIKQQIEIAEKQKKVVGSKLYPELLIGYFNQTFIGGPLNASGTLANSNNRFQGIQVGLTVPLWFFSGKAQNKASEFQKILVEHQYEKSKSEYEGNFKQAIQAYLKEKQNVNYYTTSGLPSAEILLKQASSSWLNGDINYLEYLVAIQQALDIRKGYLQALLNINTSALYLDYLSGSTL